MATQRITKSMRNPQETMAVVLRWCLGQPVNTEVAGVTAKELAVVCIENIGQCPLCGAEAWVNIDCALCTLCSSQNNDAE